MYVTMNIQTKLLRRKSTRFYLLLVVGLCYEFVQFQSSPSKSLRRLIQVDEPQQRQLQQQRGQDTSNLTGDPHYHSSPTSNQPNILLFVLDQWRYDWDGFHASPTGPIPLNLPFYTSMASKGVRFTQAYVPSPICAPVRACLASGKEYDEIGMTRNSANDLDTNTTTFYKLLRDEAGYHTMTCGKDDLFHGDVNFPYYAGVDYSQAEMDLGFSDAIRTAGKTRVVRIREPFFDPYRTYLEQTRVTLPDETVIDAIDAYRDCWAGKLQPGTSNCESTSFREEQYPDTYVQRSAITLLDRKPDDKPWFLQVNFPGPHPPNLATKAMAESVIDREWPLPYDTGEYAPICPQQEMYDEGKEFGPQRDGRCNYGAQIEHIDSLMEQTVRHLDNIEELDNTIICITGDHGEMLGDHGLRGKSKPWQGAISVPLLCFGPGVKEDSIHSDPVTTLDLPGTFLDYAGYGDAPYPMSTRSLRPLLQENGDDGSVDANVVVGGRLEEDRRRAIGEMNQGNEATDSPLPPALVRESISSGYDNWRAVIKVTSGISLSTSTQHSSSYKLICCRSACPGSPLSASPVSDTGWHILLYDTIRDPFDMVPLEQDLPSIVEEMMNLLPDGWGVGNLDLPERSTLEMGCESDDDCFYGNEEFYWD